MCIYACRIWAVTCIFDIETELNFWWRWRDYSNVFTQNLQLIDLVWANERGSHYLDRSCWRTKRSKSCVSINLGEPMGSCFHQNTSWHNSVPRVRGQSLNFTICPVTTIKIRLYPQGCGIVVSSCTRSLDGVVGRGTGSWDAIQPCGFLRVVYITGSWQGFIVGLWALWCYCPATP
jgi:hypothetical protein